MPGDFSRDLTDSELRTVARWVAQTFLEIERGHRPAKALQKLLAPHLYYGLENATPQPGAPRVAARDVGGVTFFRQSPTSCFAAVAIREVDGKWDALSMVLRRAQPARWTFVDISRASRGTTRRERQTPTRSRIGTGDRGDGRGTST